MVVSSLLIIVYRKQSFEREGLVGESLCLRQLFFVLVLIILQGVALLEGLCQMDIGFRLCNLQTCKHFLNSFNRQVPGPGQSETGTQGWDLNI